MAAFDPSIDLSMDPGYRLLHNAFVTLFWRRALLDNTLVQLEMAGYHLMRLDASGWETAKDMHRDLARAFDFPSYYGHNLDALDECLRDVVAQRYGWPERATGLVLVFTGYHAYTAKESWEAQALLDAIARHARGALLFGGRLICLVQTDNPLTEFDPVGCTPVIWNDAEWLAANRR